MESRENKHGETHEIKTLYPESVAEKAKEYAKEKMDMELGHLDYFHYCIFEYGVEYGKKLAKGEVK